MEHSLRSRIQLISALPALLAVIAMGGYMLSSRISDIESHSQSLQRLVVDNYVAQLSALPSDQPTNQEKVLREILNEPEWESVLGDVHDWLRKTERGNGVTR